MTMAYRHVIGNVKEETVHDHHASPATLGPANPAAQVFWTNGSSHDAAGTMQRGVVVVRPEYVAFLPVAAPMGKASQFAHGFAAAKGTLVSPEASRAGYPLVAWWELGARAFDGAIWTAAHGGLTIPIEHGAVVLKKFVPVTFTSTLGPTTLVLDTWPPLSLLARWKTGVLPFDRRKVGTTLAWLVVASTALAGCVEGLCIANGKTLRLEPLGLVLFTVLVGGTMFRLRAREYRRDVEAATAAARASAPYR